jgi:hypothetical protein
MTALSSSHIRRRKKRREQGRVLHSSGNNHNHSPPLVVSNEYGSNFDLLDIPGGQVNLDQLGEFFKETGLDINQMLLGGDIPRVQEVDTWKIFELGKSLYNPAPLSDLGTQVLAKQVVHGGVCPGREVASCQN